jgi:FdhE protein
VNGAAANGGAAAGPGLTGGGSLEAPPFLRPHPGAVAVFERRAARFADLAPGHAAEGYLRLLARLASAQVEAARRQAASHPAPAAFGPGALPLDPDGAWPAGWDAALASILKALRGEPGPEVRAALDHLAALPPGPLGALARRVVLGRTEPDEAALAPFLGAALQVAWTATAALVAPGEATRGGPSCPRCGSTPVAGLVLGDDRLRYLACGLCATEWHHTRAQCVLCRASGRLTYHVVEGDGGPAKAETCDACQAYLKLLYVERAPRLEPMADDVASLRLDLLMAERGTSRLGWNLYLVSGDAPAP